MNALQATMIGDKEGIKMAALPSAVFLQDGVGGLTHDTKAKTITIHTPERNYILAPMATNLGVVDAGTGEPDAFVQKCNYARVTANTIIDSNLLQLYADNVDIQNHVMNSILARIGRHIYSNANTSTTASITHDANNFLNYNANIPYNTIWHTDGTVADVLPIQIINYTTNTTASTTNGMNVTVTAHVTPEIIEQMKRYAETQRAREFIQALRIKMRTVAVHVKKNVARKPIPSDHTVDPQELKARETLREMITESEYRRYITNGFIMVRARSGLWYQIFNKRAGYWVFSFKDGKMFERLCIHTDASCPPTDHVINMKVLAEIDEEALRKGANITTEYRKDPLYNNVIGDLKDPEPAKPQESLLDVYRRLRPVKVA